MLGLCIGLALLISQVTRISGLERKSYPHVIVKPIDDPLGLRGFQSYNRGFESKTQNLNNPETVDVLNSGGGYNLGYGRNSRRHVDIDTSIIGKRIGYYRMGNRTNNNNNQAQQQPRDHLDHATRSVQQKRKSDNIGSGGKNSFVLSNPVVLLPLSNVLQFSTINTQPVINKRTERGAHQF